MSYILVLFLCFGLTHQLSAQCTDYSDSHLSGKIASYDITARLDNDTKTLSAHQKVTWRNTSPDTLYELRFYLYMNAFEGYQSSFIAWQDGEVFGQSLEQWKDHEWGSIDIISMVDNTGQEHSDRQIYLQDLDHNRHDRSIVSIALAQPILPGDTATYDMDFVVKMPKLIARAGYSLADYYLFVHWFPQVCVYEERPSGTWGWNSHQFVPGTEFFADFGDYRVTLDLPADMIVGATGCRTHHLSTGDRQAVTYQAYDVIDFAWTVYPRYLAYHQQWQGIDLQLLLPPEHEAQADRMLTAATQALTYLHQHVGPYHYPSLTIVGPPLHALRSGLMEYPMLITCGTGYGLPRSARNLESLVVHELVHQYFMAIVATNEKEEAWMDEGFVTYYEDRIIDHYYGEQAGLYDLWGWRSGNAQHTRSEYLNMGDLEQGPIGRPGWEFDPSTYKPLIYAKTATTFRTLERMLGRAAFDDMMRGYYQRYQFAHPRGQDFINFVSTYLSETHSTDTAQIATHLLTDAIYTTTYLDYAVTDLRATAEGYIASVERLGTMILPTQISISYEDGSHSTIEWDGTDRKRTLTLSNGKVVRSITVDPHSLLYLDRDLINNSKSLSTDHKPMVKYAAKASQWMQYIIHFMSLGL